MKQIFVFLTTLFMIVPLVAQIKIKDANFAKAIVAQCPQCLDSDNTLRVDAQQVTSLNIENKLISDLDGIEGFTKLKTLFCNQNLLQKLPTLPNTLEFLDCSENILGALPIFSANLNILYCYSNKITTIDSLPKRLTTLDCTGNLLTKLPTLPKYLEYLLCGSNYLSSIPTLPNSLLGLEVSGCLGNYFEKLPPLPNRLQMLGCSRNALKELPQLPSSLRVLACTENIDLKCVGNLPKTLQTLMLSGTSVTCLPNLPNNLNVIDVTLPVCTPHQNPNNCVLNATASDESQIKASSYSIFPNPAKDKVTIEVFDNMIHRIEFINSFGQVIFYQDKIAVEKNSFDLSDFPKGIYMIRMTNKNGVEKVEKVVMRE